MKTFPWLSALLILSSPCWLAHASAEKKLNHKPIQSAWQTISVDAQMDIIDDEGNPKTINPACAFDTLPNPENGEPSDNAFRFYFKQGKSKNLLVYLNGGGACWNDATCVASFALEGIPGARPAYNPSVLAENSPIGAGGVFDDNNKANPFKDWSKVYVPYCTGDIHIGSSDVVYYDVDGSITGYPGAPMTVKHHGFDNFMAVREWLKKEAPITPNQVKKVLFSGSSAGGYGATLNFPYLQAAYPNTPVYLIADGSEAVVTDGFINSLFAYDKNWNVENTLAPLYHSFIGAFDAQSFNSVVFDLLTQAYPHGRFAQYTTALDGVQVQFLKIMDQIDQYNYDPFSWGISEADFLYFYEWNIQMEASLAYAAENFNHYQYYIGAGSVHTILTDAFATEETPHPFYNEKSAQNVSFSRWMQRFVSSRHFRQQSVKYSN